MGVLEDLLIEMKDVRQMVYDLKKELKSITTIPEDLPWITGQRAAEILGCSYTTLKIKKDDWDLKYRRAGHELQFWLISVRNYQESSSVRTIN